MNREILFRVWDNVMGKYLNVNEVLSFNHDGTISNSRPRSTIEQYTGFKDKNGLKIFDKCKAKGVFELKTGERVKTYKRTKNRYAIYSEVEVEGFIIFKNGSYHFETENKTYYKTGFYSGMGRTASEKRNNESVETYSSASGLLSEKHNSLEIIGNVHTKEEA